MALKSTIFKAELEIADLDRNRYHTHTLTVARHPSETDERMLMRMLVFVLNADDALMLGKGLSSDDEPDLWQKDLTGAVELWIDVGLPDERRIRKACSRANRVLVYSYGGRAADLWWGQIGGGLQRHANLTVANVPKAASEAMAKLAKRTMRLQFTIQDGSVLAVGDDETVQIDLQVLTQGTTG